MMKNNLILILSLLISVSGFGQMSRFIIDGKIDTSAYKANRMILVYQGVSMDYVFDTILVKGDRFTFSGSLPEASRFKLTVEPDTSLTRMKGKRKFDILFSMENCMASLTISERNRWALEGSNCHIDEALFKRMLTERVRGLKGNDRILHERFLTDSFIRAIPGSYYSLILFAEKVRTAKETGDLVQFFSLLPNSFQNGFTGVSLLSRIEKLHQVSVGQKAQDFSMADLTGKKVHLSDFRGKYVLLHFWASWCNPCRQENVFLKQAYARNKNESLVFIGVSLDEDKQKLMNAIMDDQIGWMQLAALKGFEVDAAKKYGIIGIPRNFLIDPTGRIIANDLRGDKILERIQLLMR